MDDGAIPMPMTRVQNRNPWNLSLLLLGLVLGVCCFQSWGATKALAQVDEKSPMFQQGSNGNSNSAPSSQALALPEEAPTPSPGIFSTLARLVLALAVTVGLIVLTVWGLKWVWEKKGLSQWTEDGKVVRVLASTYLSPRKTIHLVEVGKRILVVGVGGDEMSCLDVIREPEEVESLRGAAQQGFPKVFNRVLQHHDTADHEAEARRILEESNQAVGGYVAQLKNMKKKKNISEPPDGEK